MKPETKQKSKKAFDIISFSAVFLLFICSLICLIARFNGAKFDLFGNRYDVVLTDSMATKNPEHAEDLKDCNNQFKAFDVAISKPLPAADQIQPHDVVIYTDRYIGTNMHRIVNIDTSYYERIYFISSSKALINDNKGVTLDKVESSIDSNDIRFDTMSITTYTSIESTENLEFYVLSDKLIPQITKVEDSQNPGYYFITYNLKRATKSPGKIKIYHKQIYDYSKELVVGVHVDSLAGAIDVDMDELMDANDISNSYQVTFNKQFIYEIRGDAAKDSDGWYSYSELQALVVGNAPGMGYPIRFMGSVWGGLMFALLAFLILIVDIIATRMDKKEAIASEKINENTNINKVDAPKLTQNPASNVKMVQQKPTVSQTPVTKPVQQATAKPATNKPTAVPPGKKIVVSPVTGKRILVDDDTPKGDKK